MEPAEICKPDQELAGDSPEPRAANQDPVAGAQHQGSLEAAPIAIDAPGLAPVDTNTAASDPITIELAPIPPTALTSWVGPTVRRLGIDQFTARNDQHANPRARSWQLPRVSRFAAMIALAIGGGAVAGSLATLWSMQAPAPDEAAALNETNVLKAAIERLNSDLVALRSSSEGAGRTASAQFVRLTERVDRVERAQSEPAAKIAKISEALERIDRRTRDIPDLVPVPPSPEQRPPPPVPIKEISRVSVVPGWVVRGVYEGTALIQGRIGLVEVEVGDPLPGGGRVQAIRRQDGHWVVVTTKGLILAAQ
jgi:hypothetical protein